MSCPKCGFDLFINEWEGWQWQCLNCNYLGRLATKQEIKVLEQETYNEISTIQGAKEDEDK